MENWINENERTFILEILNYQFNYLQQRHAHLKLIPKIKNNEKLELKDLIRLAKIFKYQINYAKKISLGNEALTKCEREIKIYKKLLIKIIEIIPIEKLIKITNNDKTKKIIKKKEITTKQQKNN